jgi:hypothetical protein
MSAPPPAEKKRKWDEPAEGAPAAEGSPAAKVVKTEDASAEGKDALDAAGERSSFLQGVIQRHSRGEEAVEVQEGRFEGARWELGRARWDAPTRRRACYSRAKRMTADLYTIDSRGRCSPGGSVRSQARHSFHRQVCGRCSRSQRPRVSCATFAAVYPIR